MALSAAGDMTTATLQELHCRAVAETVRGWADSELARSGPGLAGPAWSVRRQTLTVADSRASEAGGRTSPIIR